MDDRAKKEIEKKGYENILKDFVNNKYTEYCYDWQGLDADIILPCIEQALSEIERLNNIIDELEEDFAKYHKEQNRFKWYEEDYIEFIELLENKLKGSDK